MSSDMAARKCRVELVVVDLTKRGQSSLWRMAKCQR